MLDVYKRQEGNWKFEKSKQKNHGLMKSKGDRVNKSTLGLQAQLPPSPIASRPISAQRPPSPKCKPNAISAQLLSAPATSKCDIVRLNSWVCHLRLPDSVHFHGHNSNIFPKLCLFIIIYFCLINYSWIILGNVIVCLFSILCNNCWIEVNWFF